MFSMRHATRTLAPAANHVKESVYRTVNNSWEKVALERMQIPGACNPPNDAGRHPLAPRFLSLLRHPLPSTSS